MSFTIIGLNHQTAPVSIRERLAFPEIILADALTSLKTKTRVSGAMILSTCNRTEIYCCGDTSDVLSWLSNYHHLAIDEITCYLYRYGDFKAIQHAFRVACGLDSMFLGEPQILGQLKKAVQFADHQQVLGQELGLLWQKTFAAAKEIRSKSCLLYTSDAADE